MAVKKTNNWSLLIKEDFNPEKHWHNETEYAYVEKGFLVINIDGVLYRIEEGELFIIGSGIVHCYIGLQEQCRICVAKMNLEFLKGFNKESQELFSNALSGILHIKQTSLIVEWFQEIKKIMGFEDTLQEGLLASFVLNLAAYIIKNEQVILNRVSLKKNHDFELLSKLTEYIDGHMNEKIALNDMANVLGFSESYCSRWIKKVTNMNFLEYLNYSRIFRAEESLRNTNLSVTEIAYSVGFSSISTFNRVFKQFLGVNPSEFRNNRKKKVE